LVKRISLTAVLITSAALTVSGSALAAAINGTAGPDVLPGTQSQDLIHAGGGNDRVEGLGERDSITGDDGADLLYGDDDPSTPATANTHGNDWIEGCAGDDTLYGGGGADTLLGDDGELCHVVTTGNDRIYGGAGNDELYGGDGNDNLYAFGDGTRDVIHCGPGVDIAYVDSIDVFLNPTWQNPWATGTAADAGCEYVNRYTYSTQQPAPPGQLEPAPKP
jgi:Ca2+-binding RTX toxin-like protein